MNDDEVKFFNNNNEKDEDREIFLVTWSLIYGRGGYGLIY